MNIRKIIPLTFSLLLLPTLALRTPVVNAASLNFTAVQNTGNSFNSLAIDPVTGYFYEIPGLSSNTINVYDSLAALEANKPSSLITLSGSIYGSYIAANNGILYGKTLSSTVAAWSLSTGSQIASSSFYTGMDTYSFNWGGGSYMNFMESQTGAYVLGASTSSQWVLDHVGENLAPTTSILYNPGTALGYGFVVNGTLFTSASYDNPLISQAVNVNTGAVTPVSYTITGVGSNDYLSDFTYNPTTDTLYAYNTNMQTLYAANNASVQLSASTASTAVPGPGVFGLFALSLLGLLFSKERRGLAS